MLEFELSEEQQALVQTARQFTKDRIIPVAPEADAHSKFPVEVYQEAWKLGLVAPGLVHLHVYGDGPERARIEQGVRRNGIEQSVTLHGAVRRPQEALAQIGLLVLRSDAEGFGLVLIEAMAAGNARAQTPVAQHVARGVSRESIFQVASRWRRRSPRFT